MWRPRPNKMSVSVCYLTRLPEIVGAENYARAQNNCALFGIDFESPHILVADVSQDILRCATLPVPIGDGQMPGLFSRNTWIIEQGGKEVVCFSAIFPHKLLLIRYTLEWNSLRP